MAAPHPSSLFPLVFTQLLPTLPFVRLLHPAPSSRAQNPRIQLTRLLLVCIEPGRRFFCPLLFQPFYSDPEMKTLAHADWLSRSWKQALTNEQALTRRRRAEAGSGRTWETNKRAGGAGGGGGLSLCSATLKWSHSPTRNPGGIAVSPFQSSTPKPCSGLRIGLGIPQLHVGNPRAPARLSHSPLLRPAT